MNLGTLGLLGLLQTATPPDIPKSDSISFLRDSVVIPYIMEEERGSMHFFDLPFTLYSNSTNDSLTIFLPSFCKVDAIRYGEGKIISAASCRDMRYGREAFLSINGYFRNSENFIGRVMVDWEKNNTIDFCGEVESIGGKISGMSHFRDQCQSFYLPSLKTFQRAQQRKNTLPPRIIGD